MYLKGGITMTPFEFVCDYREKYGELAAKDPRVCGIYTANIKYFRALLSKFECCSPEEKHVLDMFVRECSMLNELATHS